VIFPLHQDGVRLARPGPMVKRPTQGGDGSCAHVDPQPCIFTEHFNYAGAVHLGDGPIDFQSSLQWDMHKYQVKPQDRILRTLFKNLTTCASLILTLLHKAGQKSVPHQLIMPPPIDNVSNSRLLEESKSIRHSTTCQSSLHQ
jgi:hypothetical protein